jgi:hypothetical protein
MDLLNWLNYLGVWSTSESGLRLICARLGNNAQYFVGSDRLEVICQDLNTL